MNITPYGRLHRQFPSEIITLISPGSCVSWNAVLVHYCAESQSRDR
jgi:hypothetical protein